MLKIIFMSIRLQMKQSWSRETYRFCFIAQPIIYTLMMYALYEISGSQNFMSFVILGSGIITLWSTIAFSSAGDLERERRMGTLKYIFSTPTDYRVVVFGKVLGNTLLGMVPLLILLAFSFLFQRELFRIAHVGWFLAAFIGVIVSFMSISLVFSALFTLSRQTHIFMNCMEFPIYILCGITFSISHLPVPLRAVSCLLSPTWAVELLRMSIEGIREYAHLYFCFGMLAVLSLCYFAGAYVLLGYVDRRVRIDASLEVS